MKSKDFLVACILGFIGITSFFQVGSAFADDNRANAVFVIIGILFTGVSIGWIGYKYAKQGGNPNKG